MLSGRLRQIRGTGTSPLFHLMSEEKLDSQLYLMGVQFFCFINFDG